MNELKITQAQLALTEKVAALSGVVAGMAHEMNTPVGVSVTAASFIQDTLNDFQRDLSPGLPPHPGLDLLIAKLQESAGIIVRNLDRVAKEIHLFKDIAVYQTGEDRQELHLLPYLQDIAMSLRSRLRSGGHQLKIDCPEELWIKQYPGALVQIIANLSANALVHAFEHQAKGVISIEVSWREPNVHLEFSDNGQGMAPEVLQHLFEPFFTTKRGSGGTGLGLTVVYNLVTQRLGGSISCRSAPGQGTSFRIIFPRLGLASDRD
jgi:signal transduction histidine kinase